MRKKQILQIDLKTDEVLKLYDSITEASRSVFGSPANIVACAKGRIKNAYGYRWAYV